LPAKKILPACGEIFRKHTLCWVRILKALRKGGTTVKKFKVREVETLKTTAALYTNACGGGGIRTKA